MATFIFVRHGESVGNLEGRLMGHRIGSHLSEKGIQQVQKSIQYFHMHYPVISKIYSSPVSRALETAELISTRYGISAIVIPELREIDFGDMTGKLLSEIPKEVDEEYSKNPYVHAHINGESLKDVQKRVSGFLDATILGAHQDDVIMMVTHDNVIRGIIGNLRGLTKEICFIKVEFASVIIYEITSRNVECIEFNKKA